MSPQPQEDPVSVPLPPKDQRQLRSYIERPWLPAARKSKAARAWLDRHGYITPHFTWKSYACTDGTPLPAGLRGNAIRLHWLLEQLRHELGDVPMTVDGPYRTPEKNRAVGGASQSRHMQADAADFFLAQVDGWARQAKTTRGAIVKLAERIFPGVGNETSGTLHLDARPGPWVRFVTWVTGR